MVSFYILTVGAETVCKMALSPTLTFSGCFYVKIKKTSSGSMVFSAADIGSIWRTLQEKAVRLGLIKLSGGGTPTFF